MKEWKYDHDEVELLLEAYLQEVETILNQAVFQQSEIEAYEGLGSFPKIFLLHPKSLVCPPSIRIPPPTLFFLSHVTAGLGAQSLASNRVICG